MHLKCPTNCKVFAHKARARTVIRILEYVLTSSNLGTYSVQLSFSVDHV